MARTAFVTGVAGVAALAVTAACNFPDRNNPNDPVNRPRASVVVSPLEGYRSTPFTIDASGSSGPEGVELRYAFDLDGDGVFEREDAGPVIQVPVPVDSADFPAGIGSVQKTVRVRVSRVDDDGVRDEATAAVLVLNDAPRILIESDLFVPELTGGRFVLDACGTGSSCRSGDPDGDAVSWQWQQLRGDPVDLTEATTATPSFLAPRREQTLLFRATASDGITSVTRNVRVHVTTQVWVTTIDPTRVYHLHPDSRLVARWEPVFGAGTTSFSLAFGGLAADGDRLWAGVTRFVDGTLDASFVSRLVLDPSGDLSVDESWDLPVGVVPSIAASGDGEACATRWVAFDPASHAFVRLRSGQAPVVTTIGGREPRFVHAGPEGTNSCWGVAGRLAGTGAPGAVYLIDGNGAVTASWIDVLDEVGASARDADGSLWVAGSDAAACPDGSALLHLQPASPAPSQWCLAGLDVDGLAHAAPGLFAHDRASGRIVLVGTDGSAVATDAPTTLLPDRTGMNGDDLPRAEPRMLYDPVEQDLWLVESAGRLVRLHRDGSSLAEESTVPVDAYLLDGVPRFAAVALLEPLGRITGTVTVPGGTSAIGWVPAHLRRVEEVFVSGGFVTVTAEPTAGSAWVADGGQTATSLRRIDARGGTLASHDAPGHAWDVVSMPDGGAISAWWDEQGSGGLLRVDAGGALLAEGVPTGAAISVARAGGLVCALAEDSFGDGILLLTDTSLSAAATSIVPAPSAGGTWFRPRSAASDGEACWATFEGATGAGELVRYDGTNLDRIAMDLPHALDADPVTGSAWLVALSSSGAFVVFETPAGTLVPEYRYGSLAEGDVNLVDLQRRCGDAGCTDPGVSVLWTARGQIVQKVAADGRVVDEFLLPQVGSLYGIDVLP